jgi:hypothetical protein
MTEGEEDEHPGGGVTAGLGLSGLSDVGPASEEEEEEEEDGQAAALTLETEAQVACFACFTSAVLVQKYKYWQLSRAWPPTLLLCLHRRIYYIIYIICVILYVLYYIYIIVYIYTYLINII